MRHSDGHFAQMPHETVPSLLQRQKPSGRHTPFYLFYLTDSDQRKVQLLKDFFSFMAHQKHIYDLMKFDSYPRFIRSEHYRRLVEMELTNNYVTENDVTQAYKKGFDTQEDKKRKKSAFKLLKNAVNPIVSKNKVECVFPRAIWLEFCLGQ